MALPCEEAAHQHDRALAHHRQSAKLVANGEHAGGREGAGDFTLDDSEKARIDEIGRRPDGIGGDDRTAAAAA
jgi:hypothetical protein